MAKSDIGFTISGDVVSFQKAMEKAENIAKSSADAIQGVMLKAAGVLAIAFGVDKFAGMVQGSIQAGKEIDSLSRQSGIAADQIDLMTHALDRSGQSASSTTSILETMRGKIREADQNIGDARLSFLNLGLSVDDLKGRSLPEQFELLATRINSIKDPIYRSAAATALLGSEGAKAVANFNAGDIQRAANIFGVSSKAMADAAPGLAQASDSFKRVQQAGSAIFDTLISSLAPVIEKVATKFESIIPPLIKAAKEFGEKMMRAVNIIFEAFKEGKLSELFFLGLKLGALKGIDFLFGAVKGVVMALQEGIGQAFAALTEGDFYKGIADGIIGAFQMASGFIIGVFDTPIRSLRAGITYVLELLDYKMGETAKKFVIGLAAFFPGMQAAADRAFKKLGTPAPDYMEIYNNTDSRIAGASAKDLTGASKASFSMAGQEFKNAFKGGSFIEILKKFQEGMASGGLFGDDIKNLQEKFGRLIGSLEKHAEVMKISSPLKPGEGGVNLPTIMRETSFDSFRRVGGGLGNAGASIAQRSLDKLTEISQGIKDLAKASSPMRGSTTSSIPAFTPAHA